MFERIRHMLIKEFIQIFRDPRMRGVIFVMPVIQLLVFSYAVTTDVRHIATGIYDLDNSTSSRDLMARFARSGYFDAKEYIDTDARVNQLMNGSDIRVVLRINKGFEDNLRGGKTAQLQIIVDGTDSNTAAIVLGYSSQIAQGYSQEILNSQASRLTGRPVEVVGVDMRTRAWFNENLESRNYYVPGLIVIIVTLITLMLTSMAVVREKEIGTMEQIMVTPIRPVEFILGKTLPFCLIGYVDALVVIVVAVFFFSNPSSRESSSPFSLHDSLPDDDAWGGSSDLDHQRNATAGDDEHFLFLFAGDFAVGVYVSCREHATADSMDHLCESVALFSGNCTGDFSKGGGDRDIVAADGCFDGYRHRDALGGGEAVS